MSFDDKDDVYRALAELDRCVRALKDWECERLERNRDGVSMFYPSKARAAARRASLDATRALAALRKVPS